MNYVLHEKYPIKIWAKFGTVEDKAEQQLRNIARLPFIFKHVAAMPDVHLGKGATVGSVIATKDAIIPAAVGVDIGCGMMAVKTTLNANEIESKAATVRAEIERQIPVGHSGNAKIRCEVEQWQGWHSAKVEKLTYADANLIQRAKAQFGSLGGGNHFIELCKDQDGALWVMLHSGSRHIGKATADRHIEKAKGLMKRMFIDLPDPDLAYFASNTREFTNYISDLSWCQDYAAGNRIEMMRRIMHQLSIMFNHGDALNRVEEINCHHNYTDIENHFGQNVWVTRKGAIRARLGDLGIIPGSMGTRSYIVEGLGNYESFQSCSHGAGRRMSRSEARRRYTVADLETQTFGVECKKSGDVIDEIPSAYKDIDEVMENQKDLVRIKYTLKQFLCVKG